MSLQTFALLIGSWLLVKKAFCMSWSHVANRLRQTCSATSICTWKKQRIWYCRKSKALRRWYGAYGRYTWALRSWQSFFFAKQKWPTRVSCTVLSKSFSETNTFPNRWMAGAQLLRLEIMQNCKLNLEMKWSRRQDGLASYIRVHFKIT